MSCLTPARRVAEEKGCSGLDIKIRADARRSGDFYAEADRISLRRTFSQVKQPIHAHLSMVRLDSNGSPVRKAQGNIIAPAAPAVAATYVKLMIGTVTAPIKKKCVAIPETMKS